MKTILTVNPGSTGTKLALYETENSWNLRETRGESIHHAADEMQGDTQEQLDRRCQAVGCFLSDAGNPPIHIVAGRGGLTRPLEAGSYRINQAMKNDLLTARFGGHASNFGALIADQIAEEKKIPSLIVDPVGVDQFPPIARYSGHPELPRRSQLHALNMRAVAREAAKNLGGVMEEYRFVIAHIGGGISIAPMEEGRLIDVNHAMDDGPFSPQRSGGLPMIPLVEMCFSGRWSNAPEALTELTKKSGLLGYLGTDDGREVVARAEAGEEPWRQTYQAMAYQISKEIGAMATVLSGRVDTVLLTGGLSRPPLSDWIIDRIGWIAPVKVYPGEREMLALARAAARHLYGEEELLEY